jgi:hypothetical protein
MFVNMLSFERRKGFQYKCNCLESPKTKRVRKTARSIREPQNHEESRKPEIQEVPNSQESPQESEKTARSQETRTSRVWKTGRLQESRSRRITPNNIALFPPARGGEREKGKRDSSLKAW